MITSNEIEQQMLQAKSEIEDESEHRSIVSKQRWTLELRQ